jgi:hypothetical protein
MSPARPESSPSTEAGGDAPGGARTAAAEEPRRRTLLALALVTACTLALQVVLTRLFSAVLPYHFSFLVISLALLGAGAGALLIYVRSDRFRGPTLPLLTRWCAAFSLLLVLAPFVFVRLDFSEPGVNATFVLHLAVACGLAGLLCFASGVIVALAISRWSRRIGVVYAYDLVGAGVGALAVVPALGWLDATTLIAALGGLAGCAVVLFADRPGTRSLGVGLVALGCAVVTLSLSTRALYLPHRYTLPPDAVTVAERWNPLARVFGFEFPGNERLAAVFYDRVYAPVPLARSNSLPGWQELRTGPQSIGYELIGSGRVLIIGGGGGRDIYTALSAGQREIDVIELNEGIRRVVDEDLAHLSGSPYSRPGVRTVIGDGRSILAARDTKYDQIHIGFTDTLSGNAAQGFALTENNLYTLEAFEEYLGHLAPRGVLSVSRLLELLGDEALRATVLTLAALERAGVAEPRHHVVVVFGNDIFGEPYGTILARLEPWTREEVGRIRALARDRGRGVAFAPGGPFKAAWRDLGKASDLESFCRAYPLDVCPPTDDRPFFFNMTRLGRLRFDAPRFIYSTDPTALLLTTLAILAVLAAAGLALPLALTRGANPPRWTALVYFGAIGVGFLLVEIVLIQRFVLFLGFPTYALSVVLFSLLVWTGVGSLLSTRWRDPRRGLALGLTAVVALLGLGAFGLQPLLRELVHLPLPVRAAVSVVLLAPIGIALGAPMPLGLRRLEGLHPSGVPFAWGVNGVTSVFASVLGVAVAIYAGFAATTLLAAAFYLLALAHVVAGRWPRSAAS